MRKRKKKNNPPHVYRQMMHFNNYFASGLWGCNSSLLPKHLLYPHRSVDQDLWVLTGGAARMKVTLWATGAASVPSSERTLCHSTSRVSCERSRTKAPHSSQATMEHRWVQVRLHDHTQRHMNKVNGTSSGCGCELLLINNKLFHIHPGYFL